MKTTENNYYELPAVTLRKTAHIGDGELDTIELSAKGHTLKEAMDTIEELYRLANGKKRKESFFK